MSRTRAVRARKNKAGEIKQRTQLPNLPPLSHPHLSLPSPIAPPQAKVKVSRTPAITRLAESTTPALATGARAVKKRHEHASAMHRTPSEYPRCTVTVHARSFEEGGERLMLNFFSQYRFISSASFFFTRIAPFILMAVMISDSFRQGGEGEDAGYGMREIPQGTTGRVA
ncbi:hypothetical protein BS47DRAFT_600129 [Hydnum rufescens UP504]|uniref:Uncharacterized protein n=1 Tax=Hydnum rufescens UP504 TaxID=1448309 RepID=A0A9P6AFQ9_9AGAM|nr:hypothetical protein BS47DRAFT_600129 [Hydnum rufescens UP504]